MTIFKAVLSLALILTFQAMVAAHAIADDKTPAATTDALKAPVSDAKERTILDYIKDYVDVPNGGIDWTVFGQTKEIKVKTKATDGGDIEHVKPEYTPAVKALDGKQIIIKGYMFPLGPGENQTSFLFGPFPLNCPYHYHVSSSLVMDVNTNESVKFSYDPIVIKGTLILASADDESGTFYRLGNAEVETTAAPQATGFKWPGEIKMRNDN